MVTATAGVLLERDVELAVLTSLLANVRGGHGAVAVIEGPPGIGKTALLRATADLAAAQGFTVLEARASHLERGFTYGIARQLLERRVRNAAPAERRRLLASLAEDATSALGLGGPPTDSNLRSMHGLYWLAANVAADRPLLLTVDDLHWADDPSLRWLLYAEKRLTGLPLAVVATSRLSEPGATQELLDAFALDDAARTVRLAPLSLSAVGTLISARLDGLVAPAFGAACHESTGGNPLLVRELLRELVAEGVSPTAEGATSLHRFGVDGVARSVRRRLAALGPEAQSVADAVAVLSDGPTLVDVATLCELDESLVRSAVVTLAAVDVLRPDPPLAFVHPLVQSSVYENLPDVRRSAMHRVAAGLRDSVSDPEAVAVHLMRVEPRSDPQVVALLRAAAASVTGRGAPDAAAPLLLRALREPPADEATRAAVLVELGQAEAVANLDGFEPHLAEAIAIHTRSGDHDQAAAVALSLGRALQLSGASDRAFDILETAWATVGPQSDLGSLIEAEMFAIAHGYAAARPRIAHRFDVYRTRLSRHEHVDPMVLGGLSPWLLRGTPPAELAVAAAEAALADPRLASTMLSRHITGHAVYVLVGAGLLSRAGAVLDDSIATAHTYGAPLVLGWSTALRSETSFRQGEVIKAEGEARAAWELGSGGPGVPAQDARLCVMAAAMLINALLARGKTEEAQACADLVPSPLPLRSDLFLAARAHLRLTQGRIADAITDLREVEVLLGDEFHKPVQNWRLLLAIALLRTGADSEAAALASAEVDQARSWQAPLAVGRALVTLGVVTSNVGLIEEGVTVLSGTEGRLDHALALIELGALLRRSGSPAAARDPLSAGMDLAARCGATAHADRAHDELIAAGSRPRRGRRFLTGPEALTAGEFRVATLAADGLTNRQIAQRLYVSQAAVQFHLRNTFRKLGISARGELREKLTPTC